MRFAFSCGLNSWPRQRPSCVGRPGLGSSPPARPSPSSGLPPLNRGSRPLSRSLLTAVLGAWVARAIVRTEQRVDMPQLTEGDWAGPRDAHTHTNTHAHTNTKNELRQWTDPGATGRASPHAVGRRTKFEGRGLARLTYDHPRRPIAQTQKPHS